jgi:diguanylate cyclase (GGDEF)-like protein
MRKLAFQDPLTGLANRRQFDEEVAKALAAPPGADRMHAVLLLDLNGFKAVNDLFGHPTGDAVLREIALRLTAAVGANGESVARFGDGEFGILATHIRSAEEASGLALRVIEALRLPIHTEKGVHTVGTGIGIALFPRDGNSAEEIIRRADVALCRSKAELGSNLCFFDEHMDVQIYERAMLEQELLLATDRGLIEPHYQPLFDLKTGAIAGFEALARWHHPSLGEVPPERFIPIAEDCGLIHQLSKHLLTTACRDARQWPDQTTLSVNVSPVQLRDSTFGLHVLAILGETGFPPHRLEIEITEAALVRDLQSAKAALESLRAAGVRIALDDFGTGYSSLYHLRNFKVDRLKIDRSFVDSMDRESESAAIVRALIGLGRGLGVQVTAEGIENATQREALKGAGCDLGQGFVCSRAIPAAEVKALFLQDGASATAMSKVS